MSADPPRRRSRRPGGPDRSARTPLRTRGLQPRPAGGSGSTASRSAERSRRLHRVAVVFGELLDQHLGPAVVRTPSSARRCAGCARRCADPAVDRRAAAARRRTRRRPGSAHRETRRRSSLGRRSSRASACTTRQPFGQRTAGAAVTSPRCSASAAPSATKISASVDQFVEVPLAPGAGPVESRLARVRVPGGDIRTQHVHEARVAAGDVPGADDRGPACPRPCRW